MLDAGLTILYLVNLPKRVCMEEKIRVLELWSFLFYLWTLHH
jgi:hypothetical protein